MRNWIAALLLAALPAQALAQTPPASVSPAARIETAGPALDAYFQRYMAEQHVPGLVYGIVADGRLVYVRAMGSLTPQDTSRTVTPDSLFRIASMSKAFTALAILKLRDVESFSGMFLGYDLLARRWVPYAYIYPFAEALAGILMITHALKFISVPVALFIGTFLALMI